MFVKIWAWIWYSWYFPDLGFGFRTLSVLESLCFMGLCVAACMGLLWIYGVYLELGFALWVGGFWYFEFVRGC